MNAPITPSVALVRLAQAAGFDHHPHGYEERLHLTSIRRVSRLERAARVAIEWLRFPRRGVR